MKQEEFFELPLTHLIDIISSDLLNVSSEEQVYEAVMSWIKHDKDERRSHLLHLLPLPSGTGWGRAKSSC